MKIESVTEMDRTDERLKAASREWWSQHSQDYLDGQGTPHLGVPRQFTDDGMFRRYLDDNDRNFRRQAFYAQRSDTLLFSELMPADFFRGKRVLEVGCGLGAHAESLVRLGGDVTCVDLSPTSVEVTRKRLVLRGLSADVRLADAERLPFSDHSFDYVWSWGVIHHSPDTRQCAREIVRVLKPGGRIGIMLYNRHSFYNWVNVVLRYGIMQGKLLRMSMQELHNRYTDGKEIGGCPLAKYYTPRQIREVLFPNFTMLRQVAFEPKSSVSFMIPRRWRAQFEDRLPNAWINWAFRRYGFLLLTEAIKPLTLGGSDAQG